MIRGALAGLGAVVAALALAGTAQAGSYTVYGCSTPNGAAAPIDGWSGSVDLGPLRAGVDGRNACTGASPRMTMEHITAPGQAREWDRGSNATWSFSAPAGTQIEAVTLNRQFSTYGGYAIAWEVYDRQGRREVCFHAGGGCAALGPVGRYPAVRHSTFSVRQICGPPEGQVCSGDQTTSTYITRAAVELTDSLAPTPAAPPTGTLVGGGTLAGTVTATMPLRDEGGGLLSTTAEVDGVAVTTRPVRAGGRCARPYTAPVPCPLSATGVLSLDTTAVADGRHTLRLVTSDVAGNQLVQGPYTIEVRNAPTSCGSTSGGRVTASFSRGRRKQRVRFGRGARVAGRVLDGAGQPVAGAEVRLLRRIARRGARRVVVGVPRTTGPDGRYALRIAPGPSRDLQLGWRRPGDPRFTCSRRLRLAVRARATLRAVRRHVSSSSPRAVFRGRLRGGYVPRRGKLVVLQGRQPGRGWRTIADARSDRRGRFRLSYRFSGAPGTFKVRARVPADAGYPYATGVSRTVTVRVG